MKYTSPCLALCAVGLVLIVAGLLWSQSLGNRAVWSEAQAVKFNEASARYHQAAHSAMHGSDAHDGHNHEDESADELAAAKAAWEAQMQERDNAIARRDFWRKVLLGGGMLAIILGGGGYLIVKNVLEE